MKIMIVVNKLSGGGAEKVAVDLSNHFCKKYDTTILVLKDASVKYEIDKKVKKIQFDQKNETKTLVNAFFNNLNKILQIRRIIVIENPNVVISFMNRTNIRVLLSTFLLKIPVIITEHNFPKKNRMKLIWEIMRRISYPFASSLVSVSKGVSDFFDYLPERKKYVINNPTTIIGRDTNSIRLIDNKKKNITAMGRLEYVKGFDILIESFYQIADVYKEWNLNILGEGSQHESLQNKINLYNLTNRIFLHGYVDRPEKIIRNSDIFVLSSRHEGFGNVIVEAMKCEVPVLSTDCPVGPREIIENGKNGLLVKNESIDELRNGMVSLIENEDLRQELSINASKKIYRFDNNSIFDEWDRVLNKIAK